MNMRKHMKEFYLDWVNNFISIERMAEYYQLTRPDVHKLIDMGRDIWTEDEQFKKEALASQ